MSSMRRNTRTSQSPRISFSNVSGALRTRISLWSLRFSLSKVVGIVLWILQGVNGHVAVTLRYSGHITVQRSHYGTSVTLRYSGHITVQRSHYGTAVTLRYSGHITVQRSHYGTAVTL